MADQFRQLLLSTLPEVRGFALALTRCHHAAEDLLQEAALKAWQARDQFQMGTNIRSWLYVIMRNEHIKAFRRRKPNSTISTIPQEYLAVAGDQETHIAAAEIRQAIGQLAPLDRDVITLVCGESFTYGEAAEALSCSVSAVKSRLWRARAAVQAGVLGKGGRPRRSGRMGSRAAPPARSTWSPHRAAISG